MVTDRQRTCRCASNMADFLNDISILEGNLRVVKIEDSDIYIPAFKESINSIYRNINKIEDDCYVNTSVGKLDSSEVFNKIGQMESIKDQKKFDGKKSDILTDLSRIRYGVVQEVKDCSNR
jgi:hypothetical protein